MVLVDMNHINEPYLESGVNVVDALLYRGRGLDVDTVIVDGEVLMRGRVMTRVNKSEVWRALKDYLSRELSAAELERIETAQELLPEVQKFYGQWHRGQAAPHYLYNQAA